MAHWLPVAIGVVVAIVLILSGVFYVRAKKRAAKGNLGDYVDHGAQAG